MYRRLLLDLTSPMARLPSLDFISDLARNLTLGLRLFMARIFALGSKI